MHQDLKLYTSHDAYVLIPEKGACLRVDRSSGTLTLTDMAPAIEKQESALSVAGLLGFIRLQAGDYMIIITERKQVGSILNNPIFCIAAFQILPLAHNLNNLGENQVAEQHYFDLLENHIKSNTFYFSYTYDLTHTLQRQKQFSADKLSQPLWERADERFFWNRHAAAKLIEASVNLSSFILPVMQGFVELKSSSINKKEFVLGLITRRSRHRAGTRYFSRGIDTKGHVSNYVETEQLVIYDGPSAKQPMQGKHQLSFVQTRGSIPVYWAQVINLKYTPRLWVENSPEHLKAARVHFDEQIQLYGPQILVNLINKKGYELPMGREYDRVVNQLNDDRIHYTHFDFHQECKNMRWDRIQLLVDELEDRLQKGSYLHYDADSTGPHHLVKQQTGVVRSNCMDCLDRTNVVQSMLARYILTLQLREIGILGDTEMVQQHEDFMLTFRHVWADNADAVSSTYSGTGALKTDFTRTGQRTKAGALQDLQNSIIRYVKNNFFDGGRQDGFNLFLGEYTVEGRSDPFETHRALRIRVVPYILMFALFMLLLNLLHPSYSGFQSTTSYLLLLVFWISVLISGVRFALHHGDQFVDWPRLKSFERPDINDT